LRAQVISIGLCKKTLIADQLAPYADRVFDAAMQGHLVGVFDGWVGALTYAMQLYFDFSGYTDMAIGISYCFGILLPINFNSPYKSNSIVEFWRRWHITLSRFLRDYLYIPLGGNRHGSGRRYVNLMATMLLGGLWHGASWTFVAWGALHGLYLVINHGWTRLRDHLGFDHGLGLFGRLASWCLTFTAVVIAWVFFRAPTFGAAGLMLEGMAGLHGVMLPHNILAALGPFARVLSLCGVVSGPALVELREAPLLAASCAVALVMPNTTQIAARFSPTISPQPGDRSSDQAEGLKPSILVDSTIYHSTTYERLFSRLSDQLRARGIVVLGTPYAALLPLDEMFDTHYHPNSRGRSRRMRALITAFCEVRACAKGERDAAAKSSDVAKSIHDRGSSAANARANP
jgi:MBOAT, membrane-bound O-acyltransferase family